ncbi:hypothetical protein ACQEU6_19330 [Spirillospora sp. CA-108201]
MNDGRAKELDELAVRLSARGCRAHGYGPSLLVALSGRTGPERVIACDGDRFRWGSDHGRDLGPVGDVDGAANRALRVLSSHGRGCPE